jgi:hypothetical protein
VDKDTQIILKAAMHVTNGHLITPEIAEAFAEAIRTCLQIDKDGNLDLLEEIKYKQDKVRKTKSNRNKKTSIANLLSLRIF